jgi:phosphatidylglycerophosphatase A
MSGERTPQQVCAPDGTTERLRGKAFSSRLQFLLATCGGIGRVPAFSGTVASAVAAGLCVAMVLAARTWLALVPFVLVGGALGLWLGGRAERLFGSKDPPAFVLDEWVGMGVAMLGLGADVKLSWQAVVAAFLLFRLFDGAKPFPVSRLDRLKSCWGIMGDDVAAGVFAAMALRLAWLLLPAGLLVG